MYCLSAYEFCASKCIIHITEMEDEGKTFWNTKCYCTIISNTDSGQWMIKFTTFRGYLIEWTVCIIAYKRRYSFLTFPSIILCLTHSFSLLVSNDTESIHLLRQKFLAPNQSSSTPCNAGSRHEKKYLDNGNQIKCFVFRD